MTTITHEGERGFYLSTPAAVVEEDRELAWAERYVRVDPDLKWILGNYVMVEAPNSNGHIFPIDDTKTAQASLSNKPLNMLHRPRQVVGNFVANEMLDPTPEEAARAINTPRVEALSAFYRYYFEEEYALVEMAHKTGQLFYSMEAVPETLTCAGVAEDHGCGQVFAYKGRMHPTYCDHLNTARSRKRLNAFRFTAGALIVPPVLPGWKDADIKELSELVDADVERSHALYEAVSAAAPHLEPRAWEAIMANIMAMANPRRIATVSDIKAAVESFAGDAEEKALIITRAKALGVTALLPGDWR